MTDRIDNVDIRPPATWKAVVFGGLGLIAVAVKDVASAIREHADATRGKP